MRIRIKKSRVYSGYWDVQVKYWWSFWIKKKDMWCREDAVKYAEELRNPDIEEF